VKPVSSNIYFRAFSINAPLIQSDCDKPDALTALLIALSSSLVNRADNNLLRASFFGIVGLPIFFLLMFCFIVDRNYFM